MRSFPQFLQKTLPVHGFPASNSRYPLFSPYEKPDNGPAEPHKCLSKLLFRMFLPAPGQKFHTAYPHLPRLPCRDRPEFPLIPRHKPGFLCILCRKAALPLLCPGKEKEFPYPNPKEPLQKRRLSALQSFPHEAYSPPETPLYHCLTEKLLLLPPILFAVLSYCKFLR